jgi:flagellar basal-body rod modification protein FlgD
MANVPNIAGAQSSPTETTKKNSTDDLGKDAFLKLLIVQLGNQDPLSPMNDTEFISQMAQFSALEQMTNLNNSMAASHAASMIGKQISWALNGQEVYGVVTAVKITNGQPNLIVEDYFSVELSKVMSVTTPEELSNG